MATSLVLAASLAACSSHGIKFETGPSASAAEAQAKVRTVAGGQSEVKMRVKHLASADKVRSDATAYVVWVQSTDSTPSFSNLGSLKPDHDLRGQIQGTTPLRNFKLLVTPEKDASATQPTADPVIWSEEIKGSG